MAPVPPCELSTALTELLGSTVGDQPEMVPSSVANRKTDGAVTPFAVMSNPELWMLNTCPVGAAAVSWPGGAAIVIASCPAAAIRAPRAA